MPAHLRPSAPTAAAALLCGDPARALVIAQRVLVQPRMSNHHRGLWGYHGETAAGVELTVQSTGIGGPSAAIVISELAELGLQRAIRIGTCATLPGSDEPPAGSKLVVERAFGRDGTSAALGAPAGEPIEPDPQLTAGLLAGEPAGTTVLSHDLPPIAESSATGNAPKPSQRPKSGDSLSSGGVVVGDLQTAAVLTASARLGIRAAAGLVVGSAGGRRLEDEPLESRLVELAAAAVTVIERTGESVDSL